MSGPHTLQDPCYLSFSMLSSPHRVTRPRRPFMAQGPIRPVPEMHHKGRLAGHPLPLDSGGFFLFFPLFIQERRNTTG